MLAQVSEPDEQVLANTNSNSESNVSPIGSYETVPEEERKRVADLINSQSHLTYTAKSYTDEDKAEDETVFAQVTSGKVFGEKTDDFKAA